MTNITKVDLNLLVVLDALLEERNVTRAAARLGYTQPTVSGMLMRLRDLFGDPLFVRTQRGLLATPRAEALTAPLKQLLDDSRHLVARNAFDPVHAEVTFRVSSNDYMQHAVLTPFVKALRSEATQIRLAIVPPIIEGLGEALARGQIDLAITAAQFAMSDLPSRLLYRDRYVIAVRRQHPLAGDAAMTVERLCNYDHVVVSPTGGSFEGDHVFARLEFFGQFERIVEIEQHDGRGFEVDDGTLVVGDIGQPVLVDDGLQTAGQAVAGQPGDDRGVGAFHLQQGGVAGHTG